MTTDQNHLTLPTNLREAADDLPRLSSSEEYWRFRNLMTWAADRIDMLQGDAETAAHALRSARADAASAEPAIDRAMLAVEMVNSSLPGSSCYRGPAEERVSKACKFVQKRLHETVNATITALFDSILLPDGKTDAHTEHLIGSITGARESVSEAATHLLSKLAKDDPGGIEAARARIAELEVQLEALRAANASLATDAGLWAREPPVFSSKDGKVEFFAEGDDAPCERLRLKLESYGANEQECDFTLWSNGDIHDGHDSIEHVAAYYPMVAATLDDWKHDRLVPFEQVLAEARRLYLGDDGE